MMSPDEEKRAFLTAAHDGNLETVRRYLDNGVDVEARIPRIDTDGREPEDPIAGLTALLIAIKQNQATIVSELLSRGAYSSYPIERAS